MWTISSIDRWDKSAPERTSSALIKFRDRAPQGGVQPLVALVRGRKLHRHRDHPQIRLALVSPTQPIASGVEPYFSPVGRFDDASRMNGAEMLAGWRENTGSHKDIGAEALVHRPASLPDSAKLPSQCHRHSQSVHPLGFQPRPLPPYPTAS